MYHFYVVMQLIYLDMWMEQVMQHISYLNDTPGIVVRMQMGNQAFRFLLRLIACCKLKDISTKLISFLVAFDHNVFKFSLSQDLAIIPHSQINNFRKMRRQQIQTKTVFKDFVNSGWYYIYVFFFHLGFLSRTFTIHRTAGEGESSFCKSSLPFPPVSRTLRH